MSRQKKVGQSLLDSLGRLWKPNYVFLVLRLHPSKRYLSGILRRQRIVERCLHSQDGSGYGLPEMASQGGEEELGREA